MNSRERFQAAIKHKSPDRVPVDIGGTTLTSMNSRCQDALRQFLGFSGKIIPTNSGVDERILQWAGTDFRSVGGLVKLKGKLEKTLPNDAFIDSWGIKWEKFGRYHEITQYPLKDASVSDIAAYPWPEPIIDEKLLSIWETEAKRLKAEGKYVVIAEHPVFGILEIACWMCGYDDFLRRLAGDADFVNAFFDKYLSIQLKIIDQYYKVLGPYIDLTTSGDDFGMQMGPMMSPRMFKKTIAPYFAERIKATKSYGQFLYWHHSCGSVSTLLDTIIDCGVDILNPIQTSATNMEPEFLKSKFGDRIVFWGGMDVQKFLPSATPDETRVHARELMDTLGKDGGYVMAPAHNMQDDIPPENIAAWVEAIKR